MTQPLPVSAPAERNKTPILDVLTAAFSSPGAEVREVLEIASGFGQHVVHFAAALPQITWHPSDPDADARAATSARITNSGLTNVRAPIDLDVMGSWPERQVHAVVVANLLHISPVETIVALCAGAHRVCTEGGLLHVYSPFKEAGKHTSAGNAEFDQNLRARDPRWGIRDMEEVTAQARMAGWMLLQRKQMPANNLSLLFQKST
ncbi:MAG: DUF938 domain-containing protein [bacterium]